MTQPLKHPLCAVPVTAQPIRPKNRDFVAKQIVKHLGLRPKPETHVFQCGAPWTAYAEDDELRELGRVEGRIQRKERALKELRRERTRVMMRCVRRMRRAEGKE